MPLEGDLLAWWSPDPRGVMIVDEIAVTRGLRRAARVFETTVDRAFEDVVAACADPDRPHGWITHEIRDAYVALHRRGHAHSVEAWRDGHLAGGLYGVSIGGLFAGESMFHRETDASKAAFLALVEILRDAGPGRLIDTQWLTPHLASLGAVEVPRSRYEMLLAAALALPETVWPAPRTE